MVSADDRSWLEAMIMAGAEMHVKANRTKYGPPHDMLRTYQERDRCSGADRADPAASRDAAARSDRSTALGWALAHFVFPFGQLSRP